MKLYRYMSMSEFTKMSAGCDIVGRKHFHANTNSSGICFLGEDVCDMDDTESNHYTPTEAIIFLSGVVCNEILVEFETSLIPTVSYGIYADHYSDNWDDTMAITEYNLPSYNRETCVPVRYGFVDKWNPSKTEWYNFN